MSTTRIKTAIVAADFNKDIVEPMIQAAEDQLREGQGEIVELVRVSGAYEIPIIAETLMKRNDIDVIVVLGYIERGETLHGEVMGYVVHKSIVDLELKYKKVVGIGIIGPGATLEQAKVRHLEYSRAAAQAALRNQRSLLGLKHRTVSGQGAR